jgi:hypothetical protein
MFFNSDVKIGGGPCGLPPGCNELSLLARPDMWSFELEYVLPMQLTASHVYVPSEAKSSFGFAVSAKTSPALISFESLNHRKTGVGVPMTLHSSETVPCSVRIARSSSMKSGDL